MGDVKNHRDPWQRAQRRAIIEMVLWATGYAVLTAVGLMYMSPAALVGGIVCGIIMAIRTV